ncbi:MAG TPA: type II toxin-antitoxin system VapC family toxin [Conexibacter sp.]|nr:type II toxin-antitoxin system VapC family toxin [Conexibacter sp.]
MPDLLVDTDVFVDHLRGARPFEPEGALVSYSTITRAELFAGRASQEAAVRTLLDPFRELTVDRAVAELGGRLRREQGVPIADALIAATALVNDLALATRNLRDFGRVPDLRLHAAAR